MTSIKVWIDQDLCTGDGLCVEIEPAIFQMHEDGLAYVKEVGWSDICNGQASGPVYQMSQGMAFVPEPNMETTIEAAEECPGECIFIEIME